MPAEGERPNFWVTLPGILTAVAGLITAVTGLLVVLDQLGHDDVDQAKESPTAATSVPPPSEEPSEEEDAAGEGDALTGTWTGTARLGDEDRRFRVRLEIARPCRLREPCGTITVSSAPCHGEVTLWTVRARTYEFYVDDFSGSSSPDCSSGAGDFFELTGDGTLNYTTGYADIRGVLHKVG